jgi:predicted SprT family Zn-dependent metalloprotease
VEVIARRYQAVVCLLCLIIILSGGSYALGRERVRGTDLQALYDQVNHDSFHQTLPPATVEWAELPDAYGRTIFFTDGSATIMVDRASVTSEAMLRKVVIHESCHISGHDEVVRLHEDDHGEAWQACMERFK